MIEASRWNRDFAACVARDAAARLGLSGTSLELISFRQNALFHAGSDGVLLRLYSPFEDPGKAGFMAECARRFEAAGFPAQRLSAGVPETLIEVQGVMLSVWEWLEALPSAGLNYNAFGALLRRLHDLEFELPEPGPAFNPLQKIERRVSRLKQSPEFPADYLRVVESTLSRLLRHDEVLRTAGPDWGPIHGDALHGNVITTPDGLKLIDFDSMCLGPRHWDLVPTVVAARRYGLAKSAVEEFLAGYGTSHEEVDEAALTIEIKELSMSVVLCLRHGESDAIDDEIRRRIEGMAAGDSKSRWRPLSEFG